MNSPVILSQPERLQRRVEGSMYLFFSITRSPDQRITRSSMLFVLIVCLSALAAAQQADSSPTPTVTFSCYWEAYTPQEYIITVQENGSVKYVSRNPAQPPDANGVRDEDYTLGFTMSPATRAKVFEFAEQANFFDGKFDYTKHAVASTGKKTLSYADGKRHFQTSYNWSQNTAIDQLTNIFSGISATIEHGRKLVFLRRFDKLGLEAELQGMERMAQNHDLAEIQIIAPTLENIANDAAVLNIARQRARRLLTLANQER